MQDVGGVTLTMSTGATLRASYVVGADGMHSIVRQASGITFTGSAYGESFVLADVTMEWAAGRKEVSLTFAAAGLTVIAPLPGGSYRIVATVDEAPESPDIAFVQRLLDERVPGQAAVTGLGWSSRFRVHHRVADRYRMDRLFLAGDAAHVHSPAGGQGMNTGIQDGYALGNVLTTGRLDDYEARRRPVAQRVVAFTDRMTTMATTRNPVLRGAATSPCRSSAGYPPSRPGWPPSRGAELPVGRIDRWGRSQSRVRPRLARRDLGSAQVRSAAATCALTAPPSSTSASTGTPPGCSPSPTRSRTPRRSAGHPAAAGHSGGHADR